MADPIDSTDLTWLRGLARALLGDTSNAEDLVQDTALAVLQRPVPAEAAPRAWLGGIARRLAARRYRGDARRTRREQHAARPEAMPDTSELVERAETAEHVVRAVRALPEPYRRTLLLRFLEGRSAEEIATEEGKPADTIRWRVRRGLELLRSELVREHDRDWSSWCLLLQPLLLPNESAAAAATGGTGTFVGTLALGTTMKTTILLSIALCATTLWLLLREPNLAPPLREPVPDRQPVEQAKLPATTPSSLAPSQAAPSSDRVALDRSSGSAAPVAPIELEGLSGLVVDRTDQPVANATVYLVSSPSDPSDPPEILLRTRSDGRGRFLLPEQEIPDTCESLDLGVSANGFVRQVLPGAWTGRVERELVVVLERGKELRGRVVDRLGRAVRNLELLVHTDYANIEHVSPSQMRQRAARSELGHARSRFHQCVARTDDQGEVLLTGLPTSELVVRSLDPGWTIEDEIRFDPGGEYVECTAVERLGVELTVVDRRTKRRLEKAAAIFKVLVTFEDGEEEDFGQWIGHGDGQVSFLLGEGYLPPEYEERRITRAVFYGLVGAREAEVEWKAPALEDPLGVTGVARVTVAVDPSQESPQPEEEREAVAGKPRREPPTSILDLDIRYDDSSPVEDRIAVRWISYAEGRRPVEGQAKPEPIAPGRFRVFPEAGTVRFEINAYGASGSMERPIGEVDCLPDRSTSAYVTLIRGATAEIRRPVGWSGDWQVHGSFRTDPEDDWFGSWTYGTEDDVLILRALQPGEWRFRLRNSHEGKFEIELRVGFAAGETKTVE